MADEDDVPDYETAMANHTSSSTAINDIMSQIQSMKLNIAAIKSDVQRLDKQTKLFSNANPGMSNGLCNGGTMDYPNCESPLAKQLMHAQQRVDEFVEVQQYGDRERTSGVAFSWTIDKAKKFFKNPDFELESRAYAIEGYPFGAKTKVWLKNDVVRVSTCFVDINHSGQPLQLQLELYPKVTYVIKERATFSNNRCSMWKKTDILFGTKFGFNAYSYETALINRKYISYSKADSSIQLEVRVEPASIIGCSFSIHGHLYWRIRDFRISKYIAHTAQLQTLSCPYFYTHPGGYRVGVNVGLNGLDKFQGKGLTFQINFLSGPNDANLSTDFIHKTKVVIFNQKDPAKSIEKQVSKTLYPNATYDMNVATHLQLEVEGFIQNDTLLFYVEITSETYS